MDPGFLIAAFLIGMVLLVWLLDAIGDSPVRDDFAPAHPSAAAADPISIGTIIGLIPAVIKLLSPGEKGRERRALRRARKERQRVLSRYQEWLDPDGTGTHERLPITYAIYTQLVALYDDTGTEWESPPPPEFSYTRAQVMSYPVEDLRGKLPVHATKRYYRVALARKVIYVPHMSGEDDPDPARNNDAEQIARFHVAPEGIALNGKPTGRNWPGSGYDRVTVADGTRQICNDWETVNYHCGGSNEISVGNCLVGDFNRYPPTAEQIDSLVQDIIEFNDYRASFGLDRCRIGWHDQLRPGWTTCPGKFFPRQEVVDRVEAHYNPPPPPVEPPLDTITEPPTTEPKQPTTEPDPSQRSGCNPFRR